MGILERFTIGLDLAVSSWRAIWHNKSLLFFPLISLLAQICVIVVYFASDDVLGLIPILKNLDAPDATGNEKLLAWVVLFLIYMVFNTIVIFFNVALISCAGRALSGKAPDIGRGLWDAISRMPTILAWAAVVSTVSVFFKMLEQHKKLSRFVYYILGAIWSVLTYFVLPVMVFERVGPFRAIVRSKNLIFKNWGEGLGGHVGVEVLGFLLSLPFICLIVYGVIAQSLIWVGVGFGCILLVSLWNATAGAVLTVAVYAFANHKELKTNYYRDLSGIFYSSDANRSALDAGRGRMDNKIRDKLTGSTELHKAVMDEQYYVVQAMLKRGADPWVKNNDGKTPLDLAIETGQESIANILQQHMDAHPQGEQYFETR